MQRGTLFIRVGVAVARRAVQTADESDELDKLVEWLLTSVT